MLQTTRLILIPATVELAREEISDRSAFATRLGADVPANWPPETVVDALPLFLEWLEASPQDSGWFGWYALAANQPQAVLVAGGGFLGRPDTGVVQMGYSVLPQYQNLGYATELVSELVNWCFTHPEVTTIVAETEWENPASVRVLEKTGFRPLGSTEPSGGMRFERQRNPPSGN